MKLSEQWLREWVKTDVSLSSVVERLTMLGLEVDAVEAVAPTLEGVLVGEVLKVERHPKSDTLVKTLVKVGEDETTSVISNSRKLHPGLKVAIALPGAKIGSDKIIEAVDLKGEMSNGWLLSGQELGFEDVSTEILELPEDAPAGEQLTQFLNLEDHSISIEFTPNRGDCLSVRGVARELALSTGVPVSPVEIEPVMPQSDDTHNVLLEAGDDCPRYVGRVIKNINTQAKTPIWMQERLRRGGIGSISAVVDVTNYVLLELGQPMHAFDINKLTGSIRVRKAQDGESLELLNGQTVQLSSEHLTIADDTGAIALAGIMGGNATAIDDETKDIFLESAFFKPTTIAGKARGFGLQTDSSYRFERGVDFNLATHACERATNLLLSIVGGEPGPMVVTEDKVNLPLPIEVSFRPERVKRLLGIDVSKEEIINTFNALEFTVNADDEVWAVQIPSHRFDIQYEEDLIEEIVRIYGYDAVPATLPGAPYAAQMPEECLNSETSIRNALLARGYDEAITYSFVSPEDQSLFDGKTDALNLSNPISTEMSVMRTTLWPGLMRAVKHNLDRQQQRVRLFEVGLKFTPKNEKVLQKPVVSGIAAGVSRPENWINTSAAVDYFDVKADLENLIHSLGHSKHDFEFLHGSHEALHPGQTAKIQYQGNVVGFVGTLHPKLLQKFGVSCPVVAFEIELDALQTKNLPKFSPISKFPSVRRDIAVVVDKAIPAHTLLDVCSQTAGEWLTDCFIFDVYEGEGVPVNKKSLAIGFILQHASRTLKDSEVSEVVDQTVQKLEELFDATLRS